LLEAPLDLETLSLSLHNLLVNPALVAIGKPERQVRKTGCKQLRSRATITLLLLVRATFIYSRCCSSRTARSWWIAHSSQR